MRVSIFIPSHSGHVVLSRVVRCRVVSGAQLLSVAALGWKHADHLPTAFLLQTLAFVALNKVRPFSEPRLGDSTDSLSMSAFVLSVFSSESVILP